MGKSDRRRLPGILAMHAGRLVSRLTKFRAARIFVILLALFFLESYQPHYPGSFHGGLIQPALAATPANLLNRSYSRPARRIQGCEVLISEYSRGSPSFNELFNPQDSSQADIDRRLAEYGELHDCLQAIIDTSDRTALSSDELIIHELSEFYLIFAGGYATPPGVAPLELIDLAISTDPVVKRLREEIGVPAPSGTIFLRYYPDRAAMPPLLRQAFNDPQVAGVTILSRYIAILDEPGATWEERALRFQSQPTTISHELVHAYANAVIAANTQPEPAFMPAWFEEGLATYLSGGGSEHRVVTPNMTITQSASTEYLEYLRSFQYLENRLGKAALNDLIRQALLEGDPALLYTRLGLPDERWLAVEADAWAARRLRNRALLSLVVLVGAVWTISAFLPELECECGFQGRRKHFPDGRCPQCGRPLENTHRGPVRAPFYIATACQLCERRFWPWQRSELNQYPLWARAWIVNPAGGAQPIPRYVNRICTTCAAESQLLFETYQQIVEKEVALAANVAQPLYRLWLANAPALPSDLLYNLQLFPFEELLESIILAALKSEYSDWLDLQPALWFWEGLRATPTEPPPDYQAVLRRDQHPSYGSIYRHSNGEMVIAWRIVPGDL